MPDAPLPSDTGEDEPGSEPTGSFRTHLGRIAIAAAMTVAAPVIRATILAVSMSPLVPPPFAGSSWSGLTSGPPAGVSRSLALRALAVALALETCLAFWHFSAARTDAALTGSWSRHRWSPLLTNEKAHLPRRRETREPWKAVMPPRSGAAFCSALLQRRENQRPHLLGKPRELPIPLIVG